MQTTFSPTSNMESDWFMGVRQDDTMVFQHFGLKNLPILLSGPFMRTVQTFVLNSDTRLVRYMHINPHEAEAT